MACCGVKEFARSNAAVSWCWEKDAAVYALKGLWTRLMPELYKASGRSYDGGVEDRVLGRASKGSAGRGDGDVQFTGELQVSDKARDGRRKGTIRPRATRDYAGDDGWLIAGRFGPALVRGELSNSSTPEFRYCWKTVRPASTSMAEMWC